MNQVIQSIRNGKLSVVAVPDPIARPGHVLIANERSLISAGTEKMVIELAQKSLLGKARERPDHVRRVLEKMRNEGVLATLGQVRAKLDEPMPMGYSSAGVVLACGAGVQELKTGDRVASNGPHAGVVCVPRNLCARVPDGVPADHAVFTVLGAIALQGVRLAELRLGETALVIGLGLIGQLTVALLKAAGCRVLATDLDAGKCQLARQMGADEARVGLDAAAVTELTGSLGADGVLIAASTKTNGPIELASGAVRKRGRIVLLGVVGLELDRRPLYFKEAELVVSCSYGPGRYDPEYEERGRDYPAAYVRWTEQRNMQAVLELMGSGKLDVAPLVSHRFPIERATEAYDLIEKGIEPYLGILLEYPGVEAPGQRVVEIGTTAPGSSSRIGVGVIGTGSFARSVLIPAIREAAGLEPVVLCDAAGLPAVHAAGRHGFARAVADEAEVLCDGGVGAVFVATRHEAHAGQVVRALGAGKHVFVEKPLCMTVEELSGVEAALVEAPGRVLMVGFNRRFSPAARLVKAHFEGVAAPLAVAVRFNAGAIPADHWTQDEVVGGGRIVGEACHAIDLATFLAGAPPVRVFAESVGAAGVSDDQCFITLRHANGAVSSIGYLAGGDKAFPKERVEVLGGGRVGVIDDFRTVTLVAGGRTRVQKLGGQDKGHRAEVAVFATAARGGGWPIPWAELRAVTLASLLAVRSLREGVPLELPE